MNRSMTRSCVVALCLAGLTGCSTFPLSFSKPKSGLEQVDTLLARIEQVQAETLLARQRAHFALGTLQSIVAESYDGDASQTFSEFLLAIERSEKQASQLEASLAPMQRAADKMVAQWTADLEEFSSPEMRDRSQTRLDDTRRRYQAILDAVEPAHSAFEAFNLGLRDHALFLGHDFNSTSVSMIEGDVQALALRAVELDRRFDECLAAAQSYVQTTALRGQVEERPNVFDGPAGGSEESVRAEQTDELPDVD